MYPSTEGLRDLAPPIRCRLPGSPKCWGHPRANSPRGTPWPAGYSPAPPCSSPFMSRVYRGVGLGCLMLSVVYPWVRGRVPPSPQSLLLIRGLYGPRRVAGASRLVGDPLRSFVLTAVRSSLRISYPPFPYSMAQPAPEPRAIYTPA